jgi:hypothetical protein
MDQVWCKGNHPGAGIDVNGSSGQKLPDNVGTTVFCCRQQAGVSILQAVKQS